MSTAPDMACPHCKAALTYAELKEITSPGGAQRFLPVDHMGVRTLVRFEDWQPGTMPVIGGEVARRG